MLADSQSKPSEDAIYHIIKSIYGVAEFSPECLIISLLFIERLRTLSGIPLRINNWQPLLLASMIVAQKVRPPLRRPPPSPRESFFPPSPRRVRKT